MMETLTLQQSTIRGTVLGKAVFCTLRGSPAGLQLAAGSYLLQPPQNNPVYGLVMVIEPLTRAAEAATSAFDSFRKAQATAPGKIALGPPANPSAVKLTEPAAHKATDPAAVKFTSPSAVKMTDPSAVKFTDPSGVKMTDPSAVKFTDPSAVKYSDPSAVKFTDPSAVKYSEPSAVKYSEPSAVKYSEPSAVKFTGAAAHKFTDPSTVKYGPAAAVATLGLPQGAPAIKFDTAAGQVNQPVVISERSIAGNSFQATAGFSDLVEVVQRAGAVKLVVV
jgi:ribosomal protein L32E